MDLDLFESDSDSSNSDNHVQRLYRERINFQINDDIIFNQKFRIKRSAVNYITCMIGNVLKSETNRNGALTPIQKIFITLHWLGCGSQYHVVGDCHGVSKSTVQRCVYEVTDAIVDNLMSDEVRWPTENVELIAAQFYQKANFSNVAGKTSHLCLFKL